VRRFLLSIVFIGDIPDFIDGKVNGLGARDNSKPKGTNARYLPSKVGGLDSRHMQTRKT
jgi:hypothetical protein